jgi:hypothetical protein
MTTLNKFGLAMLVIMVLFGFVIRWISWDMSQADVLKEYMWFWISYMFACGVFWYVSFKDWKSPNPWKFIKG